MRLLSRTVAAFTFSAERLQRQSEKLYFWTFTFRKVPWNDSIAMQQWGAFHERLRRAFPDMQGLRVCELHKSHGIHFHCIVNLRVPIDRIRRMFRGSGILCQSLNRSMPLDFGRISVTRCDGQTYEYLCKYMTKQYRDDNNFGRRRRWGAMGGFKQTKLKDIEYDSPFHRSKNELFPAQKINYTTMLLISHYSTLWGEVRLWPREFVLRVANYQKAASAAEESAVVGEQPVMAQGFLDALLLEANQ